MGLVRAEGRTAEGAPTVSVGSLSTSISGQVAQAATTGTHRRHDGGPLAAAAKALGMSQDDLTTELKSGKSLDDVAKEKGVSQDTLNAAVKASLPPQVAASSDVDDIVGQITSRKGLPQRPGGPPPAATTGSSDTSSGVYGSTLTADQSSTLTALSSLLGTDSGSLLSSLQSGTSLSDLLTSNNIDLGTVAGIMQDGLLIDTTA
jgi:hypothetical protein